MDQSMTKYLLSIRLNICIEADLRGCPFYHKHHIVGVAPDPDFNLCNPLISVNQRF